MKAGEGGRKKLHREARKEMNREGEAMGKITG